MLSGLKRRSPGCPRPCGASEGSGGHEGDTSGSYHVRRAGTLTRKRQRKGRTDGSIKRKPSRPERNWPPGTKFLHQHFQAGETDEATLGLSSSSSALRTLWHQDRPPLRRDANTPGGVCLQPCGARKAWQVPPVDEGHLISHRSLSIMLFQLITQPLWSTMPGTGLSFSLPSLHRTCMCQKSCTCAHMPAKLHDTRVCSSRRSAEPQHSMQNYVRSV